MKRVHEDDTAGYVPARKVHFPVVFKGVLQLVPQPAVLCSQADDIVRDLVADVGRSSALLQARHDIAHP